ncbi:hypothetical protein, partial [Paenirhodobacter ferrireducens]|uniref:hypothetical protein n=1 Tax=Paenirhodobacter ferrireducens TaxID=1215032 RepID=UPI0019D26CA7
EVVGAAAQTQKSPRSAGRESAINEGSTAAASQIIDIIDELVLVAGAGNRRFLPELKCAV